jgi:hypothetical protein
MRGLYPSEVAFCETREEEAPRLRGSHPVSTLGGFGRDQAAWAAAVVAHQCQGSSSVMRLAG